MTSWSTTRSSIFADSADTRTPTSGARAWISPCLPGTTTWSSGWEQTLTGPRTTPTLTSWWTLLIGLSKLSQDCVIYDVFRRNGIVIIDECPGVALDHFEAGNFLNSYSLILSLYWLTICRLHYWITTWRLWLSWLTGTRTTLVLSCGLSGTNPSHTEMPPVI